MNNVTVPGCGSTRMGTGDLTSKAPPCRVGRRSSGTLRIAILAAAILMAGRPGAGAAPLELASPFTDHAVLQQGTNVPIWGWAGPGATVRVSFAGREAETKADTEGRWILRLPPLAAASEGRPLRAVSGETAIEREDVVVGEVWLASGQSNMEMPLAPAPHYPGVTNWEQEIAAANVPRLRMFTVAKAVSQIPQPRCGGTWQVCAPGVVSNWSAAGYFFGRDLLARLDVPVGIVHASWPGSGSAAWVRRAAMETDPSLKGMLAQWDGWSGEGYAKQLKVFELKLAEWEAAKKAARKSGQAPGPRPKPPHGGPDHHQRPANLWCGMVAPVLPYAARGVIWYQGETPGLGSYHDVFETVLRIQIADWRMQFGTPDLTFLIVQLTNWKQPLVTLPDALDPWAVGWARQRDDQIRVAATTAHAGTIVGHDLGGENYLHPPRKQAVGKRLALAAAALAYGQPVAWSGPLYREHRVEGDAIRVFFDHQGGGLMADGGTPLRRFALCGAEPTRQFVWADARIETAAESGLTEDTVVVRARSVSRPYAVRYAFEMNPEGANLSNRAGLPAHPFRTDDWAFVDKRTRQQSDEQWQRKLEEMRQPQNGK
jgi:sialate O-acetylesterase